MNTPQTRTANDNYALYETDREAKRKTQPASAQPYLAWRKISDAPENYSLWTRNDEDGKAIYQCARQMPGPSEGGYYNAESAFKVKGLKPAPATSETRHGDPAHTPKARVMNYSQLDAAFTQVSNERDEAKLELAGTKANLALTEAQRDDWQEKHASALVELMTRTSERDEALAKLAQRDKDYSGCFEIREQYKLQRDELEKAHKDEREQKQRWFTAYKKASAAHDAVAKQRDELQAKLSDAVPADIHLKITGQLKQDLAKAEAQLNQAGERGAQVSTKADADPECSLCTWEGRRCTRHRAMDNHERIRRAVGFIGMSREALIARINKLEEKGTQS